MAEASSSFSFEDDVETQVLQEIEFPCDKHGLVSVEFDAGKGV